MTFDELVLGATGHGPYSYQRRVAEQGLPDLLEVPTGAGKTLAAVLPWLHRRRFHVDLAVRRATPRWLVLALPMRVLVEQSIDNAARWIAALGLESEVGVYSVMGGEGRIESAWRMRPEQDAIFVGTIDMLLSRALNRGYGTSRFAWPIDFGLFSAGTQWVFDEVQLMGPALPTSRQLEGLRTKIGSASPTASMWMSATVDHDALKTVDNPDVFTVVELDDEDRAGPLARRLDATRTIRRLELKGDASKQSKQLAAELVASHRPGTRTLAILNTVDRARELTDQLVKLQPSARVVLVHSRFRPPDRWRVVGVALEDIEANGPGMIVVSTQVLEAGVDISSSMLFTEAAPWPSIVQRAGRCNRAGEVPDALLLWAPPAKAPPYEQADVDASIEALSGLEGRDVTAGDLAAAGVAISSPIHPTLRRRDLLELFDTTPDLSGSDVDVSRFIRDADGTDVSVAWWDLDGAQPDPARSLPLRDERCPVPIGELMQLKPPIDDRQAYRFDHLDARWVRCRRADLRPGMVVVFDTSEGGYTSDQGWSPKAKGVVDPLSADGSSDDPLTSDDVAVVDDPLSENRGRWLALNEHLEDAEQEAKNLLEVISLPGLTGDHQRTVVEAARLHDLGKAHPVFQETMKRCAADGEWDDAEAAGLPLAKSGGSNSARHGRRYFRHELVSALALLDAGGSAIDPTIAEQDRDLVVYLVAAHHGRVRIGFRSLPDESRPEGADPTAMVALGVEHSEALGPVMVPRGIVPESTMDLSFMALGSTDDGRPSWTQRALGLRDRQDLGPFRLATLEALVRVADWRASARADERL